MVFLSGANSRVVCRSRCSTLRWCLKKETSLVVVSKRSTRPNLSYIFTPVLPKRCLMQVPSMRVAKRLPSSWASCGVIFLPRKLATCSADRQHGLARQLLIQRLEGRFRAKDQVGGILHLHQAPVIS